MWQNPGNYNVQSSHRTSTKFQRLLYSVFSNDINESLAVNNHTSHKPIETITGLVSKRTSLWETGWKEMFTQLALDIIQRKGWVMSGKTQSNIAGDNIINMTRTTHIQINLLLEKKKNLRALKPPFWSSFIGLTTVPLYCALTLAVSLSCISSRDIFKTFYLFLWCKFLVFHNLRREMIVLEKTVNWNYHVASF